MSYSVEVLRRAQKALARLPQQDYQRVRDAIGALAEEVRPTGCKKLTAREGWRIRVGQHRVIYEIDDALRVVTILDVGHRRDIFK